MEKVLAVKNHEGLCWKCLKSFDKSCIHEINIPQMGYGSAFDGEGTMLQLCDDCYTESNPDIWSMEERHDLYDKDCGEDFVHEDEMLKYIGTLPVQGKQFVWNEFNHGWNSDHKMEAQDWIDYQLDILPHERCKEYGFYSPQEISAYKTKFTTCEYPVNRIYSDTSKGCWCPFDAYGEYGQKADVNICDECYECNYYKERITPIKDISDEDFEDYMQYLRYQIRKDELAKKFESA